jgi:hypothetical protein
MPDVLELAAEKTVRLKRLRENWKSPAQGRAFR